ncbi:MAG: hypothetical protein LRZ97_00925 [Candidatus Pacebacteria bacterium]|nr:hypothetical protein [Candidatus Paceibacterota bacterium]
MKYKHNLQKGFTLLLASLIASLLLAVGLSMFTIAQKEIILSGLGRESQYAFYAADTGAECALYWAFKDAFDPQVVFRGAKCNGQTIGEYRPPTSVTPEDLLLGGNPFIGGESVTDFWFEQILPGSRRRCIKVQVTKYQSGSTRTKIDSRGYNVGCDSDGNPILTPRTLERAVRMVY